MAAAAQKLLSRMGTLGVGLAVAGGVAQSALYNGLFAFHIKFHIYTCYILFKQSSKSPIPVDGGQRAVIFDRFSGVKNEIVGEGTHFIIPWVQRPIHFDIRSTPRAISTITGSKGSFV